MVIVERDDYKIIIPDNLSFYVPHVKTVFYDYVEHFKFSEDKMLDFSNPSKIFLKNGDSFWFTNLPSFNDKAEFFAQNLQLKPDDVVFYVGAYCGLGPIAISKIVTSGHVYAFEADVENCRYLMLNIQERNITNITIIPKALNQITEKLYISKHHSITSSVSTIGIGPEVESITVEEVIEKYNITKLNAVVIDVGGSEYNILTNSTEDQWIASKLFDFKPKILVETHTLNGKYPFPAFQNFMKAENYSVREIERFFTVFPTFLCKPLEETEGPDSRIISNKFFRDEFPEFTRNFTLLALAGSWNDRTRVYDIYACNDDACYWQSHISRFFKCYDSFIKPLLIESFVPKCRKFTFLLSDGNQYGPYSASYIIDNVHIQYPCFAWAFEDKFPENYEISDLSNIILIPDYYIIGDTVPHRYIDNGIKLSEYWKYSDELNWDQKDTKFFWRGAISCLSTPFPEAMFRLKNYLNERLKFLVKCRESKYADLLDCSYSSGDVSQVGAPKIIHEELQNYKLFSTFTPRDEFWKSKFIFAVEGYSYSSPATYQTLASNSCPIFIDTHDAWWYKHNFIEGQHYIGIKRDLSDFEEKIEWCLNNLDKCREIAKSSKSIIERINPKSALDLTSKVFKSVLEDNNWDFKSIYDFTDRRALLEFKMKKEENENFVVSESCFVPVSLGGWCGIADVIREGLKLNPIAYPFDYVRTTFEGILHYIKNDFEGFLPTTGRHIGIPGNTDLILYPGTYNAFYSHDPTNIETKEAFLRRFKKFDNLLKSDKTVVFFRAMTSLLVSTEMDNLQIFTKILQDKYPNLKYKLVTITHRAIDEDINSIRLIKTLENIYIWSVAIKYPVEHNYCIQYRRIIEYTMKFLSDDEEMLPGTELHLDTLDMGKHDQTEFEYYNHWPKDSWLQELGYSE